MKIQDIIVTEANIHNKYGVAYKEGKDAADLWHRTGDKNSAGGECPYQDQDKARAWKQGWKDGYIQHSNFDGDA